MRTEPLDQEQAVDELLGNLRAQLLRRHARLEGVNLNRLAAAMAASVPAGSGSRLGELTGPFYDTSSVASWLGVSRQRLHHRAANRQLLACKTADGHLVYPVWQFTDDGQTISGLREVLDVLAQGTNSSWTWAQWMKGSDPDVLEGLSPAEWLRSGRPVDNVLTLARHTAAAWAA